MADSGIPLGPGLLGTWVTLPAHAKKANARINTETIATSVRPPILASRSLFAMRFSFFRPTNLLLSGATTIAHVEDSGSRVGDQCCDSQHECNARKSPFKKGSLGPMDGERGHISQEERVKKPRQICGLFLFLGLVLLVEGLHVFIAVGHGVPALVTIRITSAGGRRSATALVRRHTGCIPRRTC
jgi:hypothetical protein